jgi:hypothetical protein
MRHLGASACRGMAQRRPASRRQVHRLRNPTSRRLPGAAPGAKTGESALTFPPSTLLAAPKLREGGSPPVLHSACATEDQLIHQPQFWPADRLHMVVACGGDFRGQPRGRVARLYAVY